MGKGLCRRFRAIRPESVGSLAKPRQENKGKRLRNGRRQRKDIGATMAPTGSGLRTPGVRAETDCLPVGIEIKATHKFLKY